MMIMYIISADCHAHAIYMCITLVSEISYYVSSNIACLLTIVGSNAEIE